MRSCTARGRATSPSFFYSIGKSGRLQTVHCSYLEYLSNGAVGRQYQSDNSNQTTGTNDGNERPLPPVLHLGAIFERLDT